jgi:transposase
VLGQRERHRSRQRPEKGVYSGKEKAQIGGREPKRREAMEKQKKQESKKVVVELMEAGCHWQEAIAQAGISAGRSTVYSWWKKYRKEGESGLIDGRHGHPAKVTEAVLRVIEEACKRNTCIKSSELQRMLKDQMQVSLTITHLNETRAVHGWSNQTTWQEKKRQKSRSAGKREQEGSYL